MHQGRQNARDWMDVLVFSIRSKEKKSNHLSKVLRPVASSRDQHHLSCRLQDTVTLPQGDRAAGAAAARGNLGKQAGTLPAALPERDTEPTAPAVTRGSRLCQREEMFVSAAPTLLLPFATYWRHGDERRGPPRPLEQLLCVQLDVGSAVRRPAAQRAHAVEQLQRGGLQQGLLLEHTAPSPTPALLTSPRSGTEAAWASGEMQDEPPAALGHREAAAGINAGLTLYFPALGFSCQAGCNLQLQRQAAQPCFSSARLINFTLQFSFIHELFK